MQFTDLPLAAPLLRAVADRGYETASPIQAQTIPHTLEGRDVLGCAQTGTGKTAAFALPTLHRLTRKPTDSIRGPALRNTPADRSEKKTIGRKTPGHGKNTSGGKTSGGKRLPRCLVLAPTRELAQQIADSFRDYGQHLPLTGCVVYGGVNQNPQVRKLQRGVDIVVATPGRLLDLMNQGHVDLSRVETFVLDEADRMLDMGFIPDIRRITKQLPAERQTLMFSATMPSAIAKLAKELLTDPVRIDVAPQSTTAERVEQALYFVDRPHKPAMIVHLLNHHSISRAIVFTRTKHGADKLVKKLRHADVPAEAIHGNKTQNARQRSLDRFRDGRCHVLVATDIAARGIDVDNVSHVFNYDLPDDPESYVHRIGRTARAGASGIAITFCDAEERGNLTAVQRVIQQTIPVRDDHPEHVPVGAGASMPDAPASPRRKPARRGGGKPRRPAGPATTRRSRRAKPGSGSRPADGKPPKNRKPRGRGKPRG